MEGKHICNNNCFFCFLPFSILFGNVSALVQRIKIPLKPNRKSTHAERNHAVLALYQPPLHFLPPSATRPKTTFQRNPPPPWELLGSTFEGTTDLGGPPGSMRDAQEPGWRPGSGLGRLLLVLVHPKGGLLSRQVCSQPPAHARVSRMGRGTAKELLCPPNISAARCSGQGALAALPFQHCKVSLRPCPAANAVLRQLSGEPPARQSPPLPAVPGAEPVSGCRTPEARQALPQTPPAA